MPLGNGFRYRGLYVALLPKIPPLPFFHTYGVSESFLQFGESAILLPILLPFHPSIIMASVKAFYNLENV